MSRSFRALVIAVGVAVVVVSVAALLDGPFEIDRLDHVAGLLLGLLLGLAAWPAAREPEPTNARLMVVLSIFIVAVNALGLVI